MCMTDQNGEVLCSSCAQTVNNTSPNKAVQNMINRLQSKCLSISMVSELDEVKESCPWIGRIGEWEQHGDKCQFMVVSCLLCKTKCRRNQLPDHYEICGECSIDCPLECGMYRYIICTYYVQ